MDIMKADIASLEKITPLFNAYRMFYDQTSNLEGARQFLQERIGNQESVIFLAMEGEVAVGFAQLYPTFSSVGMKKGYILNDLFVETTYRKKGIGRALIQEVFQFCKERHAYFVQLETAPDNVQAKTLYEIMGMQLSNDYDCYVKRF
ncbi:GNAT family N-acetyltransferase [Robertmurraya korlensis]|uniref:GNAT family N-acetyltransferase n=1 Tax=Robertmurraya korlensis TaxID=519977 RepID=UPI002041E215|nr:GNAT family N-acetyltransferase [Robertmurraya korlensis]MCM3600912.1 GNAT family N-acetyltransferase [Robertmurraya korlensis]